MVADSPDTSQRLILCLVADEEVIERFPAAVRFLQVGLIDEPVDVILVVPDHKRARSLASGPTTVITHRKPAWPLGHWARHNVIAAVRQKIDSLHRHAGVIVHGLSLTAAPIAGALAAELGAELVLKVTSVAGLHDAEMLRTLDRASALITPAEVIREAIRASPMGAKSVEVVPLGVETDDAPAAFNNPQAAPSLIFAGALDPRSGVDTLLHATKRVLRRYPNVQLFILGKGPAEADFRHLAKVLDISLNVTFVGRLEPPRPAMRAADIFCLPRALSVYREEPIHAMASGLAIVAAQGVLCDGLVHRQTALLFPDQDEADLAVQIGWLLENPRAAQTIAATAQAYTRQHHAVSHMVTAYLRIYRRLIARLGTLSLPANQ